MSLGTTWDKSLNAINDPNVNYHTFDLHKEVGHTRFTALQKLWDQMDLDTLSDTHSFYSFDRNSNRVIREQMGVIRTNCKDNLDRTNLVQHHIAQRVAHRQLLSNMDIEKQTFVTELDKQEIMKLIRIMWADCGDATSIQYAGTPAMRSDFAKTGKSSITGALKDASNSLKRYYINNFEDGEYQDAVDVFLQKRPLVNPYKIDIKPRGNIIQRFLGNIFYVIFTFFKPSSIDGLRIIWGFFWMLCVFLTWTAFRLDPNLIVSRPVLRNNAKPHKF